ncbi:MAG TPA: UDP-N-acetylmuramoyl-tripeptide--D-alanyl-D-alanine ligase [Bacteroidales bacterium]|nr:UDP-N-acetylmuramoyl-tripeptide--D-alanyl-D-alanine ligase [Bacteroidales bacterium]HOK75372.1 UDP-N-acetylmuramoyl-tripeptide--D-alanyl-D-alanine ligase [Bacteroidales bacterium]HPP92585.1 UDP-N-acetylmuramoyl-tripeptide--D-alanyl-D-alanine ligase [Bacteroidales bacterium]HRR16093.1 UDP-N-acetylmuramoyl-tripeptide--D-alanyl-D-alanine ligase [Bacteroidales bacterium]HRT47512.1 UDP-N-acetylmuramoyl-tripeptide--D-alanyl-D-alanine ligase [Bacteroidales bacterium]
MKTEQLYSIFRESKGVSTDSRTVNKGEMFFALWGNNYNGNQYAAEALGKGACCAVIDDPLYETEGTILVDDCLLELQALATHYRKELGIPVLAITGTNGKTTTKELINAIMARSKKVHASKGNLNNHIGVPLTILSAPPDTELMIIEMGASHQGEIRTLCMIARPDYGIITNIGSAHLEGFGTFESIVKAKTELYEYLKKVNGVAFYNDNNPLITEQIYRTVNRAVPYSAPDGTPMTVEVVSAEFNLVVKVYFRKKEYIINTNLFGRHNEENIRAALTASIFLGATMEDAVAAIESYKPELNRSQIRVTEKNTVFCDSYNANPESMRSAIISFSEIKADKKLIILGDMLELGSKSQDEHLAILKMLNSMGISNVMLVGPVFKSVAKEFGYKTFYDSERLREYLKIKPVEGAHILVKGSRGMMLEKIYDML